QGLRERLPGGSELNAGERSVMPAPATPELNFPEVRKDQAMKTKRDNTQVSALCCDMRPAIRVAILLALMTCLTKILSLSWELLTSRNCSRRVPRRGHRAT